MKSFEVRTADGRTKTHYADALRVENGVAMIVSLGEVIAVYAAPISIETKYISTAAAAE
ncbi:MAG: hypothetical protein RQ833_11610 [Sphingomonadaceae bacterium]|nr:hypothetical protein [Sphingomonadaceae bacterium]